MSTFTKWNGPDEEGNLSIQRDLNDVKDRMAQLELQLQSKMDAIHTNSTLAGNGTPQNPLKIQRVHTDGVTIGGNGASPHMNDLISLRQVFTDHTMRGKGIAGDPLSVIPSETTLVRTDNTLKGEGTSSNPLGLAGTDTYLDGSTNRKPLLNRGLRNGRRVLDVGNPSVRVVLDSRERPLVIDNSISNLAHRERRIAYTSDIIRKLSWQDRVTVIFENLEDVATSIDPGQKVVIDTVVGNEVIPYYFMTGDTALVMENARLYTFDQEQGVWNDQGIQLQPIPGQTAFVWFGYAKAYGEERYNRNFVLWTPKEDQKWHIADAIAGPRGAQGDPGIGFKIIGIYSTIDEAPQGNAGESVIVDSNLFVWVVASGSNPAHWELAGPIGVTPHIGPNGNWFIGGVDQGMPSQGITPHIENNNWYFGDVDTGVRAEGIDGLTPHIEVDTLPINKSLLDLMHVGLDVRGGKMVIIAKDDDYKPIIDFDPADLHNEIVSIVGVGQKDILLITSKNSLGEDVVVLRGTIKSPWGSDSEIVVTNPAFGLSTLKFQWIYNTISGVDLDYNSMFTFDDSNTYYADPLSTVITHIDYESHPMLDKLFAYIIFAYSGVEAKYWFIGDVNTGVKAEGIDGDTPYIDGGHWFIGGVNTGVKAEGIDGEDGEDGKDGVSPHIGPNNNWWIGDFDTGVTVGSGGLNPDNFVPRESIYTHVNEGKGVTQVNNTDDQVSLIHKIDFEYGPITYHENKVEVNESSVDIQSLTKDDSDVVEISSVHVSPKGIAAYSDHEDGFTFNDKKVLVEGDIEVGAGVHYEYTDVESMRIDWATFKDGDIISIPQVRTIEHPAQNGEIIFLDDIGALPIVKLCSDNDTLLMALSSTGALLLSVDGKHWIPSYISDPSATDKWTSICYGNGKYVAVNAGDDPQGYVAYSTDGIDWYYVDPDPLLEHPWQAICYGNGMFVAVSLDGSIMYSTNAETWTVTEVFDHETDVWLHIAYGDGVFIATAMSDIPQIIRSEDGINWNVIDVPSGSVCRKINYGDGVWVIISKGVITPSDHLIMSTDSGLTWVNVLSSSVEGTWEHISYDGGRFVGLLHNPIESLYKLVYSLDHGNIWIPLLELNNGVNTSQWQSLQYFKDNIFIASSYGGSLGTPQVMAYIDATYTPPQIEKIVSKDVECYIRTGSDPLTDYQIISGGAKVHLGYTDEQIVKDDWDKFKIGDVIPVSLPRTTVTRRYVYHEAELNDMTFLSSGVSATWRAVCFSYNGTWDTRGMIKAVRTNSSDYMNVLEITHNPDLISNPDYVALKPLENSGWNSICSGRFPSNDITIASTGLGSFPGQSYRSFAYSRGGGGWLTSETNNAAIYNALWIVCYGSAGTGIFVAIARGTGAIFTSVDGETWTSRTSSTTTTNGWNSICWSQARQLFVAVSSPLPGVGTPTYYVKTSPDGITWTNRTSIIGHWNKVQYIDILGLFVAIAEAGSAYPLIMVSIDGINWSYGMPSKEIDYRSFCYGNGLFVFVKSNYNEKVYLCISSDLETWTDVPIPLATSSGIAIVGYDEVAKQFVILAGGSLSGTTDNILRTSAQFTPAWTETIIETHIEKSNEIDKMYVKTGDDSSEDYQVLIPQTRTHIVNDMLTVSDNWKNYNIGDLILIPTGSEE